MLLASHGQNEEPTQAGYSVTMEQCSPVAAKTETSLAQLGTKLRQRTRVGYQSSVDVDNPVPIDYIANPKWKHGQLCWEAQGRCAEDYKSKETALLKELNQSRRESFSEVAISLFMIGKTPQKAKPMIIISSEDKRSREEAKRAIERSGILGELNYKIGFLKYLPSGPIHSVAGSPSEVSGVYTAVPSSCSPEEWYLNSREDTISSSSNQPGFAVSSLAYYDSEQRLRTTAMPIYVKTAANRSRTATANMIYNGTIYKYITVSHVFSPWGPSSIDSGEDDLGIPFDSDSEDEDHCNSETSQARGTTSASLKVPTSRDSNTDSAKSHGTKISTMPNDSLDTTNDLPSELLRLGELSTDDDFDKSADYAIITINDFKLQKQLANLALSNPDRITQIHAAEPKSSRVTAWTRHGAISGTLGNVPRVMRFSGSKSFQSIYEFVYGDGSIESGDSGSLVFDESGKELYGMIIAASNSQSIAYVMAAKGLVPSIASAGGWRFMRPANDHTNINQSHEMDPSSHSQPTYNPGHVLTTSGQPAWDNTYQRYLHTVWDDQYRMYYRTHHVEGEGWVFFDWLQVGLDNRPHVDSGNDSKQIAEPANLSSIEGTTIVGSYTTSNPVPYEYLDQNFRVQQQDYFSEGRMFAVLFIEPTGTNAANYVTNYNGDVSPLFRSTQVESGPLADVQVRRFIVVKHKREFCYAVPVFTYNNRATTKPGIRPDEHAIAYSYGYSPHLVAGEQQLQKRPIAVVMTMGERPLSEASRIYFGVYHPVQYNVKVKDLGYVHPQYLATFLEYWKMENEYAPEQDLD